MDIARLVVDIASELRKDGISIRIVFTGGGSREKFDTIREYARQRGVLDRFRFTGYVSDEELNRLMRNATALLAPLPENLQSVARFPTKLGYYLASGRPVITNAVGDVQTYLLDNVNACIATACAPELFAQKVSLILSDPDSARRIGNNGKAMAFNTFHYLKATHGLVDIPGIITKPSGVQPDRPVNPAG